MQLYATATTVPAARAPQGMFVLFRSGYSARAYVEKSMICFFVELRTGYNRLNGRGHFNEFRASVFVQFA